MKPPAHHVPRSRPGQQGIALIIVLGLLAVLVVLGVSFSISMRTERMATRSYVDVVKARQLVHAAFNRVLDDAIYNELEGRMYPELDAFSSGTSGSTNALLGNRLTNSATVFVPASVRGAAFQAEGSGERWLELRDPVTDEFHGEYAYLVVNCSGLLDVNQIAGNEDLPVPRNNGDSPAEIRFHPDLHREANPTGYRNIDNYRAEFRKFESLTDLNYLCADPGGVNFSGSLGVLPLVWDPSPTGPWADHLAVFSRFPNGYGAYDPAYNATREEGKPVYIGGVPASWNLVAMKNAISDLEQPSVIPNADHMLYAMYDYADEGYVSYPLTGPETAQFQRFSVKPVPMVNEVIVSNSLQTTLLGPGQTQLIHRVYVTVETWFPFPADPDNAQFAVSIDQPISVQVQPGYPAFQGPATLESGPTPAQFDPSVGTGYNLTTFVYVQRQTLTPTIPYIPVAGSTFNTTISIPGNIRVTYAGKTVDMVFSQWANDDFRWSRPRPSLTPGAPPVVLGATAKAVNDPRINWAPNTTWIAGSATPSPGVQNTISAPNNDELGFMYCRRGPMKSVGELGYLLYDNNKPWQTIRLIGEDPAIGAKLIDRFTVFTNELRRGLVNVNSRQTNALAATLWTLPIEKYPGASGGSTLAAPASALSLADHLIQRIAAEGSVTNLSDLAERLQPGTVDGLLGTANDKFSRESMIRNSIGLWGTRHQLYTIFVAARTFSDAYVEARNKGNTVAGNTNDFVTAEQRAVAVIWRDPFVTTNDKGSTTHQSFVQFFHWFSGAFWEE